MNYNVTYRKKDKGWQAIISYKDNTGKWKQKSKQGFKTQKEAKPIIKKMLQELEKRIDNSVIKTTDINLTFKDTTKIYLEHSSLYKEYSTIKAARNCFSKFNTLNDIKIIDIKKYDIQLVVDSLIKQKLKVTTIETYLRRLSTFFRYVRDDLGLIIDIPTFGTKIPKQKSKPNKIALNKIELKKLLDNLKDNNFYIIAYIAANTGMRLGEILGLTWDCIDFKRRTITVNKQWKVLEYRKSGFGELKSKNSFRMVPISQNVIKELKKYKKNTPIDINNRVAPFNSNNVGKYLNPELRKLAGISLHELRHTYATMLISNGLDFKTVAKILGHDVEQTMRTYSHVNNDMMKKAEHIIENIF
jgi:integrase